MKSFNIFLVFLLVLAACKQHEKQSDKSPKAQIVSDYTTIGKEIDVIGARKSVEMLEVYKDLALFDTLSTKFTGKVTEVCQAKGCWMKVQLKNEQEVMVRFKDYELFMPKDLAGQEVLLNGLAFVEEISVEDLRHLAKDGGKTEAEIMAITDKKKSYGFEADGVLIFD